MKSFNINELCFNNIRTRNSQGNSNRTNIMTKMKYTLFILTALVAVGTIFVPILFLAAPFVVLFIVLIVSYPIIGYSISTLSAFLYNVTVINGKFKNTLLIDIIKDGRLFHIALFLVPVIYIISFNKIIKAFDRSDPYLKKIIFLTMVLFCWAIISLFWTNNISHGINMTLTLLCSILVFQLHIFFLENRKALNKMLHIYVLLGVILGILMVLSKWYSYSKNVEILNNITISFGLIKEFTKRAAGFAPTDTAASIINRFVFFTAALMYGSNFAKRIVLITIAGFLSICTFLTASKAGVITLILGVYMMIFLNSSQRFSKFRLSILITIPILFVYFIFGGDLLFRIKLAFTASPHGGFINRSDMWEEGFKRLFESYGLGVGAGGMCNYLYPVVGPHSFYFSFLFELGVVGLILLLAIILISVNYFKEVLKVCKDKEMIFIIYCFVSNMISFAVNLLVEGEFPLLHIWVVAALMLSVLKVAYNHGKGWSDPLKITKWT